jgi:Rieske Fe-S protein
MGKCYQCGNTYDKSFDVVMDGETFTFDSFECAIAKLAPLCPHCGCRVIGHGAEQNGAVFCCAHCATRYGADGLVDRNDTPR